MPPLFSPCCNSPPIEIQQVQHALAARSSGDVIKLPANVTKNTSRVPLELLQRLAHPLELRGMGVAPDLPGQPQREAVIVLPKGEPRLGSPCNHLPASPLIEPGIRWVSDVLSITVVSTATHLVLPSSITPARRPTSMVLMSSHSTLSSPARLRQRVRELGSSGGRCWKNTPPVKRWK